MADLFSATQAHFCGALVRPGLSLDALVKGQLRLSLGCGCLVRHDEEPGSA